MAKGNSSLSLSDVYKKEHRQRRRIVLGATLLIVYGIFLGGTWLVIRSPLFRIQHIEVSGNQRIPSADIVMFVISRTLDDSFWKRVLGFQNILVWSETFPSDDLKPIPELKGLSVKKDYGKRSIAIAVEERQPFAVWCAMERPNTKRVEANNARINGSSATSSESQILDSNSGSFERDSNVSRCWWFDNEGVLFANALQAEGNLIAVVDDYSQKNLGLGSNILPGEFIPNMFSVFRAVSDSGLSVKEIRLDDLGLQEVEVDTYTGPKLYFSLRFPADNTPAVIQSLEQNPGFSKLEYVDFRTENRAYYR